MKKLKLYLETSVWNFYYADDVPEKQAITRQFFHSLPNDKYELYISDAVLDEIEGASHDQKNQLLQLTDHYKPVRLDLNTSVYELANAYLRHQILPVKSGYDAQHIAAATVYQLDAIVSWNSRQIANLHRQRQVQAINLSHGYTKPLQMITPIMVAG
ncbi:MAG: hypothetical protein BWK78_03195 [Thiotrichaceae bacterium IS1]|nr:MAG: hypothetical protein BWK78_03195 [Thiotrichaceae bacterium IS1]